MYREDAEVQGYLLPKARRVARLGFLTPQAIAAIDAWLKASEE
jgi:hypothetical protein